MLAPFRKARKDRTIDSDADPAGRGYTFVITLKAGQFDKTIDAGLVKL